MSTVTTTNTIEPAEITDGSENGPEASKDVTEPVLYQLKASLPLMAGGQRIISGEAGLSKTDECTYETQETDEPYEIDEIGETGEAEESQEPEELEEKQEVTTLGPALWRRIDEAISKYRVPSDGKFDRPLFMVAHEQSTIENELNVRLSLHAIIEVVQRWREQNHDRLDEDYDYLTEYLDKLSLVRYPRGRALLGALEIARNVEPPEQTAPLSSDVQLLASLCGVLQQRAGKKPFFLDGRSAAKVLGKPHETVASWPRALCRLDVIRLISKGRRGVASRYVYLESNTSS